jgi:hypothetical protein
MSLLVLSLIAIGVIVIGLSTPAFAPITTIIKSHIKATTQPANTSNDQQAFGIAAGSSLPALANADLAARLDGIQALGVRWIRLDFDWGNIQPQNSSSYDWSSYDQLVSAIHAHNLQLLGVLDYTPAWARSSSCASSDKCTPASTAQFAAFAAAVAHRYSSKGAHTWEIWNEPNSRDFWQPTADPSQYTKLLRDAYVALHDADSRAYVITAGLSPQATGNGSYAPYDFLAALYAKGAQNYFDAVGDHPYTFPLSPANNADDAWNQMASSKHSFRSLMVDHGDTAKKIWITEFGAPTGGPGPVSTLANPNLAAGPYVVDEALQAKILSDAIRAYHTYTWAGPFFYYSYQDAGIDPSTNENFFGLVDVYGRQKPAYTVLKQATPTVY